MPLYRIRVTIRGVAKIWSRSRGMAKTRLRRRRIGDLAAGLSACRRILSATETVPFRRSITILIHDGHAVECHLLRRWQTGRLITRVHWRTSVLMQFARSDLSERLRTEWTSALLREEVRLMRQAIGGTWRYHARREIWTQVVRRWPRPRPWRKRIPNVWWFDVGRVT